MTAAVLHFPELRGCAGSQQKLSKLKKYCTCREEVWRFEYYRFTLSTFTLSNKVNEVSVGE